MYFQLLSYGSRPPPKDMGAYEKMHIKKIRQHVESQLMGAQQYQKITPLLEMHKGRSPNVLSAFPRSTLGLGLSYVQILVCVVAKF